MFIHIDIFSFTDLYQVKIMKMGLIPFGDKRISIIRGKRKEYYSTLTLLKINDNSILQEKKEEYYLKIYL